MEKSRWTDTDYKNFKSGDLICRREDQSFIRLVVKVDEEAVWCAGLVHAAFTENADNHPVFPMRFDEIENGDWGKLLKLGNLRDYTEYITRVQDECMYKE